MQNVLNTDLSGKVAVVTGAGGVLCSAFSKTLARAGAKVALLDLNFEAAKAFADEITSEGGTAKAYSCNVLDRSICESVAEEVKKDFGDRLEKVLLYGSYAREDYNSESDIDVMALVNMPKEALYSYRRKVSDFSSEMDLR